MTLRTVSVPNLLGGVSQQPENLRFRNQATESVNAYPSLVEGLNKRRPTEHLAEALDAESNVLMHLINRDPSERYAMVMADGVLKVYDLINEEWRTVVDAEDNAIAADDLDYLSGADFTKDVKLLTVADFTFVLNRAQEAALEDSQTKPASHECLVTVKAGNYGSTYTVKLNGTSYSTTTEDGSLAAHRAEITTDNIASELETAIGGTSSGNLSFTQTAANQWSLSAASATGGTFRLKIKVDLYQAATASTPYESKVFYSPWLDFDASNAEVLTALTTLADDVFQSTQFNPFSGDPVNNKVGYTLNVTGTDMATGYTIELYPNTANLRDIAWFRVGDNRLTGGGGTWTVDRSGSTLWIRRTDGADFNASVEDGNAGNDLLLAKEDTQRFSELPKVAPDGYLIKIVGDPEDTADDYYLEFQADTPGGFTSGSWVEAAGPSLQYQLDATTMPHVLVSRVDVDGTITGTVNEVYFQWQPFDWAERTVGDNDSNPAPSFIGKQIAGMTFHRGRLVLMSGESVALSEAGESGNFWRTSVIDLLDSDRIDITAATDRVSLFRAAVTSREECVIFSEQTQFRIDSGGELLTPSSAALLHVSSYQSGGDVDPVNVGNLMFFPFPRTDYSGVNQYANVSAGSQPVFQADEVSEHVPKYIAGQAALMAACELERVVAVVTSDRDQLYLYKWHDASGERVQSAWFRFDLGENAVIRGVGFIDSRMYLLLERQGKLNFESMQLQDGLADPNSWYYARLDRRVDDADVVVSYDANADVTTFTLPYLADGTVQLVTKHADGQVGGKVYTPEISAGETQFTLDGDFSAKEFWVGEQYVMQHTPGPVFMNGPTETGRSALIASRFQVRQVEIAFNDTYYFKATVTPLYRDSSEKVYSGVNVQSGAATIGEISPSDGTLVVPVMTRNDQYTLVIENDSPFPSAFTAMEIKGRQHDRGVRVG